MKKIFFLLAIFYSAAHAALPPMAQSIREIEAILSDPQLYQILGSAEMIQRIEQIEHGHYIVLTRNHSLQVTLNFIPLGHPGPAKFSIEFHTLD